MSGELKAIDGYRTPQGGDEVADHEIVVWELPHGLLEVDDPLFEESYRIGDQSTIPYKAAENIILQSWKHNALSLSTRQLTNTAEYATKPGTDRWSRMGHMISVAVLTARYGGSEAEVISAALHDSGHRLASHRTDDLLEGRGAENAHDRTLVTFLQRNGFFDRLQRRTLIDRNGQLTGDNGAFLYEVLAHDELALPRSFTNQPSLTQSMEVERLQYIAQEAVIWIYEPSLVREALKHAIRAEHGEYGEHIVFDDAEAARIFMTAQVRCSTEHWNDPLNDVIDELLMTLDRRLFVAPKIPVVNDQYFPGDVMYTTEETWQDYYQQQAEKDPFSSAILKIADALAKQQRSIHENYDRHDAYRGPVYPSWVFNFSTLNSERAHTAQGVGKGRGNFLTVEMLPGKPRTINPWVEQPDGRWDRLYTIMPELQAYKEGLSQWCASGPYDIVINFDHPSLGLTAREKQSIGPGVRMIKQKWPKVLERPLMPGGVLKDHIAQAAERARRDGRIKIERPEAVSQTA
ncbi:MAG: hypothetical protein JWP13_611 [Candidatus Saccharibacteria bacterium]|nr:hypothetical protein [Candidatus Saccharibacteria bacterium]